MRFILICFFFLFISPSFGKTFWIKPMLEKRLVATKGDVKKYYSRGNGVAIVFGETKTEKIKGYILKITADSLTIATFNKKKQTSRNIAINQMQTITKINIRAKRQSIISGVILVFLAGVFGILYARTNPIANGFIAVLAIIYGVSAFYVLVLSFLFIWGQQSIRKRKKTKGWRFSVEN